jgi:hypothetical protein
MRPVSLRCVSGLAVLLRLACSRESALSFTCTVLRFHFDFLDYAKVEKSANRNQTIVTMMRIFSTR